jgi:hypothetical protein
MRVQHKLSLNHFKHMFKLSSGSGAALTALAEMGENLKRMALHECPLP